MKKIASHSKDKNTRVSVSRRRFLQYIFAAGAYTQLPLWYSCQREDTEKPLNYEQMYTLVAVQNILFPQTEPGPGAIDVRAEEHFLWFIGDRRQDPEEIAYLIKGLNRMMDFSKDEYGKKFTDISPGEQVQLVVKASRTSWGENWLSAILTLIFEALLSHPVYGYNRQGNGWKWLEHIPGKPEPDEKNKYDEIFQII